MIESTLRFCRIRPDHRILNTTLRLTRENSERAVVLVSKDINLRMKAKSLGMQAEDYEADKVKNMDKLYTGKRIVEHCHADQIDLLYNGRGFVPRDEIDQVEEPRANENFILRNGSRSALATFSANDKMFRRVDKNQAYGIQPRNAEQAFALTAPVERPRSGWSPSPAKRAPVKRCSPSLRRSNHGPATGRSSSHGRSFRSRIATSAICRATFRTNSIPICSRCTITST